MTAPVYAQRCNFDACPSYWLVHNIVFNPNFEYDFIAQRINVQIKNLIKLAIIFDKRLLYCFKIYSLMLKRYEGFIVHEPSLVYLFQFNGIYAQLQLPMLIIIFIVYQLKSFFNSLNMLWYHRISNNWVSFLNLRSRFFQLALHSARTFINWSITLWIIYHFFIW